MAWTVENQGKAFLTQLEDRSVSSAFYDLVNHFNVAFLQRLADDRDSISEIAGRVYASASESHRVWIDGALTMLTLIKEGHCRCEILVNGVPASPLNLEKSRHMHNVDAIEFHYNIPVTGRYDCVHCGRRFTVTVRSGDSEPKWRRHS